MLVSSFLALKPGIIVRQIHLINLYWFSFHSAGSRLGEEIWVSKTAHHFIGCSDATKGHAGTPTCVACSSFERHILFCFRRLALPLSVYDCLLTVKLPSADANAVTESNHYLMIVNSGGLSKQRTGVSKSEFAFMLVVDLSQRTIVFSLGPTMRIYDS